MTYEEAKARVLAMCDKLTIENVVELCRHYRAPYSSYGHMMSYLTQYHAMPPKEYRR